MWVEMPTEQATGEAAQEFPLMGSRRGGMPMSGINTPTGVTPSVSGEDGSAQAASRDHADGDVQSAHTPRQPFSFAALPSHLGTPGESAPAHDAAGVGAPGGRPASGRTPKIEPLNSEPATGFHGCDPPPSCPVPSLAKVNKHAQDTGQRGAMRAVCLALLSQQPLLHVAGLSTRLAGGCPLMHVSCLPGAKVVKQRHC